jgi:hypothetical protein
MRKALLATFAVAALTACSEAASEPSAVETEALIATAAAWTPADLTRGLQVDDATRREIEAGVTALHAAMLDLHARHEKAGTLEGGARAAYMAELQADVETIHEQHRALWESLDPAVREALAERFHERLHEQDDGPTKSLHERMRRMHGGNDGAGGVGH